MDRCPGCKPTMSIFTKLIVSTTKHRSMRPCGRSPTSYGWARCSYIGVSEWTAQQIQDGHDLAEELGIHLISNQPQYSMLWRVIEGDVVPVCVSLGISQIVFSPIAQGVLTGKYRPGEQPPTGSRATDEKGGADTIKRWMRDDVLK
jgi:aryl-alcohol dehydrogenase-like predicted oxidoreductase